MGTSSRLFCNVRPLLRTKMNLEKVDFAFPTSIRFGVGVIQELPNHLKRQRLKRPLLVTDPGLAGLSVFQNIVALLENRSLEPSVYSDIHKNPVKSDVLQGDAQYKNDNCDCIIGVGGGASMDVARSIALKVNHSRDLFDYEDSKNGKRLILNDIPYFIAIPTTSGSGSEVVRSSVISDDQTNEKKIIYSEKLLARQVFADPELTMDLPPFHTATTGMDAFTHNLEAYLAKGFNPLCEGIALEGIRLIHKSLEISVHHPTLESRTNMMAAALMGAVAFQKGLGVIHSTAHALSTYANLHHGLANALMLDSCIRFNADVSWEKLCTVAHQLHLKELSPYALAIYLKKLNQSIGIPENLTSQGITKRDVPILAKLAFQDVCHRRNEKPVTEEDFRKIFIDAL